MTVFLIQQPKPSKSGFMPDFTSAAEYGHILNLFELDEQVFGDPMRYLAIATTRLLAAEFSDNDYFLWPNTGDPIALYVAIVAVTRLPNLKKIQILNWQRPFLKNDKKQRGYYLPVTITLSTLNDLENRFNK